MCRHSSFLVFPHGVLCTHSARISARTRIRIIRTHILCTHTHFKTFLFAKCCNLDLCGAHMAVFLNLRDDFEISVDFFCDPCARTSKSFMTVTVPDPMPRGAFKIEVRHVRKCRMCVFVGCPSAVTRGRPTPGNAGCTSAPL